MDKDFGLNYALDTQQNMTYVICGAFSPLFWDMPKGSQKSEHTEVYFKKLLKIRNRTQMPLINMICSDVVNKKGRYKSAIACG